MQRTAHKVDKETGHRIRSCDRADPFEDLFLASAVDRRHAYVPFHLRSALAVLKDWPELRALFNKAEIRCVVRETGDASIEAKPVIVGRLDSGEIISVALRHDCIDADIF